MKRLLTILVIASLCAASAALGDDLSELQAAIRAKGAHWIAKDNPLWRNRKDFPRGGLIPGGPYGPENVYSPKTKVDLPAQFDWRDYNGHNWMTPVKDQGSQCGGCAAFGALGAFEPIVKYKNNQPDEDIDLSEAHLFFCAGGTCENGILQAEVAIYLKTDGVPDEECLPYTGEDQSCDDTCSDWESRAYKVKSWEWVEIPPGNPADPELIKQAIYEQGPLYAAIELCDDFYAYESGIYEHVTGNCSGTASHAVTILGWNDTDGYWIGKNSWKIPEDGWWGEDGYFKVKYGQIQVENWLIAFDYEASSSDDDDGGGGTPSDDDSSGRKEKDEEGCGL